MTYVLKKTFSAAHFYHQKKWSADRNQAEFGKCFSEFGHGHDYQLEIFFKGDLEDADKKTSALLEQLDHQHLNFMLPTFKDLIPTTENLALYIREQLQLKTQNTTLDFQLLKLRLFETSDLWIELT